MRNICEDRDMNQQNSKIKVLHLTSSLDLGGTEKLLTEYLKSSERLNIDIDFSVVVMNDSVDQTLKKELLLTKYNVYFFNRKQSDKNPKYFLKILDIIKKHKINIIHTHNYGSKSWGILSKLLNPELKLVYTVHCMNNINSLNRLKLILHKKFVDINVVISRAVMEECYDNKIYNVLHIYNGLNIRDFIPNAPKSPSDYFRIINVSRIDHNIKGQDILIRALKICKDKGLKFKCNLVGGVWGNSKNSFEYLKKLVKEFNLEKEIIFSGNRTDIPELLFESDLFILPSRYEGFGMAVLESMAAGIPSIVSNVGGLKEIVTHKKNGLVFENQDHTDLADKIMALHSNPAIMSEIAQNAYNFVQNFDISIMCNRYYEVYKELI